MSQLLQQNDANANASANSDSQLQFFPQDSFIVGRSQVYSPNNSLTKSEPGRRSLRRAAPSPLQTSTTATASPSSVTSTRTVFSRAGTDNSSSSASIQHLIPHSPRSPKERLDELLASEQSFYRSKDSSVESELEESKARYQQKHPHASPLLMKGSEYPRPLHDTNGASRSVSDPVLVSKPSGGSNSGTQPAMASAHRAEMARGPPRASSRDSAISSLSDRTHSKKGSQDMKAGATPDVTNLIQSAGSPEAVIQHLLKEKASQTSQNAQLWRLVDKQRAMILGLNKDLERALQDKERYRKKLKESLAQMSNPSPVDSTQGLGSEFGSMSSDARINDVKAADVGSIVSAGLREPEQDEPPSPIDVALAPYPITPPAMISIQTPVMSNMVEAAHKMPSPTQHSFQHFNPDAPGPGFEAGQQQRKAVEVAREVPYNASLPPSRSQPSAPPRGPPPNVPPPKKPMSSQGPPVDLVETSPNPDEGLRSFPTAPRKAPPTPLNLEKQNVASSNLRQASGTGNETDSDYDDILEVDELPKFSTERGRRKTREEDDKEREVSALKDAEMRSASKKSGKSTTPKSRPTTPKEGSFAEMADPMPLGPRQTVQISPPGAHKHHLSSQDRNAGSLASILNEASGNVSSPVMSPGLPMSPRPVNRPTNSPMPRNPSNLSSKVNSPPMSPRGMGAFPGTVPLSPRAPRQPIPLPPSTPMSISSPGLPKGETLLLVSPKALETSKHSGDSDSRASPVQQSPDPNSIYRGLVTEEYPDLLLPPNALPSINVKVASSRLKPSRASMMFPRNFEEDPVFTLAVFARSDGRELWRVEKDSSSLTNLDQILKQSNTFTANAPDRSLFSGHAPAKVDARRIALDNYLDEILDTQMDLGSALQICSYLSTNTMEPYADELAPGGDTASESPAKTGPGGRPLKNGYLTKRGKNFGGWKARYFVLDGPVFKYYESPGGPHLGAIKLQNAQIGKQQQQADNHSPARAEGDDAENQYRHAFLILEPKRKDSSSLVRHVLCAESDQERDQWVEALLLYVDFKDDEQDRPSSSRHQPTRTNSNNSLNTNGTRSKKKLQSGQGRSQTMPDLTDDSLRGVSYETTKQGNVPAGSRLKTSDTPSPPTYDERDQVAQMPYSQSMKSISAPRNAQVIQDTSSWGNRQNTLAPAAVDDKIKQKKRSFFGFGSKPRPSFETTESNDTNSNLSQMAVDQHGSIRPVFGLPLGEAVRYNHPVDVQIELPAVVYRCIEYLDAKNAAGEEGIFRLSGSNVVIKQLRERFNLEGDVNLVTDDQYYDIHAVASLLKLYLRELPTTILTRELHLEFLAVTELNDVKEKISVLNGLVHRLPRANNALLRYLSGFLINIINHADTNKMTVRNVGIVFSPTLNIPAPVFALFLQQYDVIFGEEPDEHDGPVEASVFATTLAAEDIHSPRRQKFQDLPTPSYDQQSSPRAPAPRHNQQQQRSNYEPGFNSMQPSYEPLEGFPTMAGPEYGRNQQQTLAGPAYDQYPGGQGHRQQQQQYGSENPQGNSKSKRRESSMFGIGLGQRKPSGNKLRDDSRLVDEQSFFD
ncbi:related to BEM3 GTPase-activating protein for Cdc42p and Rho1p [Rhynchosporium secalis]|uniref:Related to BEM3 GTPase-activating protein for Cdc42p and Rho1p n=1 Tax=Rhynchosporium secalis TaxID=38038 RepID=A0A1E1M115_RHYSE|nr:related to BEM3 GTPase-activating protein for Cdc42p and Rho1p [Rhynchosporium secalis]